MRRNNIKAVLFDIDGTILKCGGAGRKSLMLAVKETFGTTGDMENNTFQGKTDLMILYESLKPAGFEEPEINEKFETIMELYSGYLKKYICEYNIILLPGVEEAIDKLSKLDDIIIGLLTGNISKGARIKLSRFRLNRYFPIGVFGDDTPHRNEMPNIVRERINKEFNTSINFSEMFIIGDTKYDIECARGSGAVSIAVGTGWADKDELMKNKPDFFFDDLSETDKFIETIRRY